MVLRVILSSPFFFRFLFGPITLCTSRTSARLSNLIERPVSQRFPQHGRPFGGRRNSLYCYITTCLLPTYSDPLIYCVTYYIKLAPSSWIVIKFYQPYKIPSKHQWLSASTTDRNTSRESSAVTSSKTSTKDSTIDPVGANSHKRKSMGGSSTQTYYLEFGWLFW